MGVVVVESGITSDQISVASEEYGQFIKVVVDIYQDLLSAGGEWHADGEKVLLEHGSHQKDLWGGGVDMISKKIVYTALINMRPSLSNSQEVLDVEIRNKMKQVIRKIFGEEYE